MSVAGRDGDRQEQAPLELPANIKVAPALSDAVAAMLLDSPTFRAQCSRLRGLTRLRLRLTLEPRCSTNRRSCRAECVMMRYEYGFIDAAVRLRSLSQASELIAHEFEHVLEYVEGLDYHAASRQRSGSVWMVADGHFETTRAIDAGRRVAAEITRRRSARLRQASAGSPPR